MSLLRDRLSTAWRLFREATGEAKWDDYLAHCAASGHPPVSRREFERARMDLKESNQTARCC